jgi:hypothetical protein
MGALEGKAQETTVRAKTREDGFRLSLEHERSSVQPPTGAVAGGGLISLRVHFASLRVYCETDFELHSTALLSAMENALQFDWP